MYEVVGCGSCGELWIRQGEAETATCPRCRKRHRVERLRTLGEAPNAETAREIRSNLLADRSHHGDFVAGYAELEDETENAGISDEAYLEAHGVEHEKIIEAGMVSEQSPQSTRDRLLDAIETLDAPTTEAIIEAMNAYDVTDNDVRELLDRLHREGAITRIGEAYRRL